MGMRSVTLSGTVPIKSERRPRGVHPAPRKGDAVLPLDLSDQPSIDRINGCNWRRSRENEVFLGAWLECSPSRARRPRPEEAVRSVETRGFGRVVAVQHRTATGNATALHSNGSTCQHRFNRNVGRNSSASRHTGRSRLRVPRSVDVTDSFPVGSLRPGVRRVPFGHTNGFRWRHRPLFTVPHDRLDSSHPTINLRSRCAVLRGVYGEGITRH
jgi:hypothetical protein